MLTGDLPFAPFLMAYLQSASRLELEFIAQVAVDALDKRDGDPDDEPNGDDEPIAAEGDSGDVAWIEWDQLCGSQKRGPNVASQNEDDENDDEDCGLDEGEPDMRSIRGHGAGCVISDSDHTEHDL